MNITNAEGKGGELISSVLGKIHTGCGKYLEDRRQTATVSDQGEGVLARASRNSLDAFFLGLIPTGKPGLRVWLLPTTLLLSVFHTGLSQHLPD